MRNGPIRALRQARGCRRHGTPTTLGRRSTTVRRSNMATARTTMARTNMGTEATADSTRQMATDDLPLTGGIRHRISTAPDPRMEADLHPWLVLLRQTRLEVRHLGVGIRERGEVTALPVYDLGRMIERPTRTRQVCRF